MGGKTKKSKLQSDIVELLSENFGDAPAGPTPQHEFDRKPSPPKVEEKR